MLDVFAYNQLSEFLGAAKGSLLDSLDAGTLKELLTTGGYRSRSALANVFAGRSLPSPRLISLVAGKFGYSIHEVAYLNQLVEVARLDRRRLPTTAATAALERLNPRSHGQLELREDALAMISEWHHLVIKELIAIPGFMKNLDWIERRLRGKITPGQIMKSIAILKRLGLIKEDKKGKLKKEVEAVTSSIDIPSEALRRHHRGMIAKAIETIDEVPPPLREISSVTIAMKSSRMKEAKEEVASFRELFRKKYTSQTGDGVFQLNVQFFEHTDTLINKLESRRPT